jgi:hypothetical protein
MNYTNKHIVKTYSGLLELLDPLSKIELIESLSKSLKPPKLKRRLISMNHVVRSRLKSQQKKLNGSEVLAFYVTKPPSKLIFSNFRLIPQ